MLSDDDMENYICSKCNHVFVIPEDDETSNYPYQCPAAYVLPFTHNYIDYGPHGPKRFGCNNCGVRIKAAKYIRVPPIGYCRAAPGSTGIIGDPYGNRGHRWECLDD